MTEQEIRNKVVRLIEAMKNNNDAVALAAGSDLAIQVLVDLNRIAIALEKLASPPEKS